MSRASLLPLGALLAALLAACAAPPPPAPPPPLSYPPAARERMLRIALAEWQEWGCATSGLPGPALTACAPGAAPRREADPQAFPRVLAYWRAVSNAQDAIARNRALYERALAGESAALWTEPFWSAAFISWVMAAAGVDAPEFAPDAAHARYLDHLDRLAEAHPRLAPFLPRDPLGHAPGVGDLVCFDRSGQPLARWADRAAERGQFRPMHCDIVVGTGPGVVEAVGGNVQDAVTLARFAADGFGRLVPGERAFLVVMENRLGLTPPWGEAASLPAASLVRR